MYALDQIVKSGNKAVFMKDPTGDWMWAFDTEDENIVYESELYGEWELVPENLSEFLVHNALDEATYSAPSWKECTEVEERLLPEILTPLFQVKFGAWRWPRPGGRVFMNQTLIAEVRPAMALGAPWDSRPGYFEVRVAASNPAHLSYLDELPSMKWTGSR